MPVPADPINIEFLFKQSVHCAVERERKAGRTADAQPPVEIKTAGAIQKKIYF
jgi:hypothetical protein